MTRPLPDPAAPLEDRLTETATARVPLRCADAWDRLLQVPPQGDLGQLLEVRQIWGSRSAPGHQSIQRYAHDLLDLELLETIRDYNPPVHLAFDQRILRYLAYDPAERLPQTVGAEAGPDPEAFTRRYVERNPNVTRVDAQLAPVAGETEVTLQVTLRTARPLGWFARRRWSKSARPMAGRASILAAYRPRHCCMHPRCSVRQPMIWAPWGSRFRRRNSISRP